MRLKDNKLVAGVVDVGDTFKMTVLFELLLAKGVVLCRDTTRDSLVLLVFTFDIVSQICWGLKQCFLILLIEMQGKLKVQVVY